MVELARIRVLGPVEVAGPHGLALLVGPRQRAVVGLLALKPGVVLPRWRLVDALWGEDPPRTAVKSLHSHIARARQALDAAGLPAVLVTRDTGYALAVEPDAVDAWRFEESVRRGRDGLASGDADRAAAHLRTGLDLWRHDVALADAEPAGWAAAEVERLSEVRLAAVEDLWDAELRLGRHRAAVAELERLLVRHPTRERLAGLLMLALYRTGRHTGALEVYRRLRARLADELGVDPGPELDALHTRILRRDSGLDAAGPDQRPASPSPVSPPPVSPLPAQLPARVGHFTGREAELAALDGILDAADGDHPVAVVSGPAGMGKTALAVQWAHRHAGRFPDGQVFVDLRGHEPATALRPADALSHVLRSLGVPADRIPTEPAEHVALYRSLLNGRRMLIVLDNGGSAEDILPLVPPGDGTVLVVTSRRRMAALATHHAVCPVLLDVLDDGAALALLVKLLGVSRVDSEPDAARELVRLCGGMPLALRIAAAKLAVRPQWMISGLAQELDGAGRLDALAVDDGSRSVRTVFASVYRTLSEPAARVFRLLGLHPGPTFTVQLAAAVADLPVADARDVVAELSAAHLATPAGADRYRFHDLIALYAQQCAAVDESAARRTEAVARLVDWYLTIADAANRAVDPGRDRVSHSPRFAPVEPPFRPEHDAALAFLDGERGNLLPVVRHAAEHGHEAAAWQLTYLLTCYHDARAHWDERVELCRWGVAAAERVGDAATRGLMLSALGVAHIMTRRFDQALGILAAALPLMRLAGDQRGEGHMYNNIATAYGSLHRYDEAVDAFERALAIHRANRNRLGVAFALNNRGQTYGRMDQFELSSRDLAAALDIGREIGNLRLEAATLHSLGEADLRRGALDGAVDHLGQALRAYRRLGGRSYEVQTLNLLGTAHSRRGDRTAALDHLERALAVARELADQHLEAVTLNTVGLAHLEAGDTGAARSLFRQALALRGRVPDAYEEAHIRRNLADLEQRCGDPAGAGYHRALAVRLYRKANARDEADRLSARPAAPAPA